eukprot:scaffold2113_cov233-Pinguiococcus_pyrenoidosus.AAC.6
MMAGAEHRGSILDPVVLRIFRRKLGVSGIVHTPAPFSVLYSRPLGIGVCRCAALAAPLTAPPPPGELLPRIFGKLSTRSGDGCRSEAAACIPCSRDETVAPCGAPARGTSLALW